MGDETEGKELQILKAMFFLNPTGNLNLNKGPATNKYKRTTNGEKTITAIGIRRLLRSGRISFDVSV